MNLKSANGKNGTKWERRPREDGLLLLGNPAVASVSRPNPKTEATVLRPKLRPILGSRDVARFLLEGMAVSVNARYYSLCR